MQNIHFILMKFTHCILSRSEKNASNHMHSFHICWLKKLFANNTKISRGNSKQLMQYQQHLFTKKMESVVSPLRLKGQITIEVLTQFFSFIFHFPQKSSKFLILK